MILGFGISAGFLAWFFSGIEWAELGGALAGANYGLVALGGVLFMATYPVRAYRWAFLLPPEHRCTQRMRLSATTIGFFATSVLPGRAGEVVRATMLALKGGVPFGTAFASIVVERVFDLIVVLLVLVVALGSLSGNPAAAASSHLELVTGAGVSFGVLTVVLVVWLVLLGLAPERVMRWIESLLKPSPGPFLARILSLAVSVVGGLTVLRRPSMIVWVFLLSLVHWGLVICGIQTILMAFLDMPILGGLLVFVFTSLAVALPQAPSFIGVFQVATESALALLSAPVYQAKGFALVNWAASIVPVSVVGFAFLSSEGLSVTSMMQKASAAAPGTGPTPEPRS